MLHSAINQQIALKTIRKLGFAVFAVWNGKEALEYLLAADEPNAPHPKPDIILMDVQMPIIDGYRATHLIRHHAPYKASAREIPIVAMTASAIQGDREKCQKAGMDDYLAKPVKGKTLEKMIVKWAGSRRTPRTPGSSDHGGSVCSEPGDNNCQMGNVPRLDQQSERPGPSPNTQLEAPRPTLSERQNSHHLTLPGTESEGDRAHHREEAEEKAVALRDEKLVEAAGPGDGHVSKSDDPPVPSLELTVENMGKLDREIVKTHSRTRKREMRRESTGDSTRVETGTDSEREARSSGERPRLQRRWQDSERTVTDHDD
jgi:CheY-like chemotaxis protein